MGIQWNLESTARSIILKGLFWRAIYSLRFQRAEKWEWFHAASAWNRIETEKRRPHDERLSNPLFIS